MHELHKYPVQKANNLWYRFRIIGIETVPVQNTDIWAVPVRGYKYRAVPVQGYKYRAVPVQKVQINCNICIKVTELKRYRYGKANNLRYRY